MQKGAGLKWNCIDQPKLKKVAKSWTHSRCGKVEFDISVSMCVCVTVKYRITREITAGRSLVVGTPLWSND